MGRCHKRGKGEPAERTGQCSPVGGEEEMARWYRAVLSEKEVEREGRGARCKVKTGEGEIAKMARDVKTASLTMGRNASQPRGVQVSHVECCR